jgi:ribosomal protein L14E/L6E/L27E
MLTTSENLDYVIDINTAKETITENIKLSAKESLSSYEMKQQKSWFDEECSEALQQRKAEFQWLQDPSQKMRII